MNIQEVRLQRKHYKALKEIIKIPRENAKERANFVQVASLDEETGQ